MENEFSPVNDPTFDVDLSKVDFLDQKNGKRSNGLTEIVLSSLIKLILKIGKIGKNERGTRE